MNMKTIESLRRLYKQLGGDEKQVQHITTIPDMIEAISSIAKDAGDALDVSVEGTKIHIKHKGEE